MLVNDHPILALIPARGGSKGLSGKNMRTVNGVPLVGYSLKAALNSKYINEVYLSSDDEATLLYGKEVGATPIFRSAEYSSDTASANSVVEHLINNLSKNLLKKNPYIVYLQPTSPLRTVKHIDDALREMMEQGLNKLVSVTQMSKSPFKSFLVDQDGCLQALFGEEMTNQRRQDIPTVYAANGAIYVFLYSDFKKKNAFPSNGAYPYIMNAEDSLDIDTPEDLSALKRIIKSNC
jgi:CMP-N,N'-diacetyllegionaminic acid synthase